MAVLEKSGLDYQVDRTDMSDLARPRTKLMLNLGNPNQAFETSRLPDFFLRKFRHLFLSIR